jgi:hypothetical protein
MTMTLFGWLFNASMVFLEQPTVKLDYNELYGTGKIRSL